MFIIWLCWLFRERNEIMWRFDWWSRARSPYGYLRIWNWPNIARKNSQPYKAWFPYSCICRICPFCLIKNIFTTDTIIWKPNTQPPNTTDTTCCPRWKWFYLLQQIQQEMGVTRQHFVKWKPPQATHTTNTTKMCPRMHFILPLLQQQKQQIRQIQLYGNPRYLTVVWV